MPALKMGSVKKAVPLRDIPVGHVAKMENSDFHVFRTNDGGTVLFSHGCTGGRHYKLGWFTSLYTDEGPITITGS